METLLIIFIVSNLGWFYLYKSANNRADIWEVEARKYAKMVSDNLKEYTEVLNRYTR